jgi:hypothetical protein
VIMSWLRLTSTSNCFPHPYYTYNMFEHIDMLSNGIQQQRSLTQFYPPYLDQILRFWVTCGVNMKCDYVMVEADTTSN